MSHWHIRSLCFNQKKILLTVEIIKQSKNPQSNGIKNETSVHLRLFVSLYIDMQVVEQGKCIR